MRKIIVLLLVLFSSGLFAQDFIKVSDIYDYKTECYNDSTYGCWYEFVQTSEPTTRYGSLLLGYDEEKCGYIHRNPTFEGFITYIEKKYSKQ